MAAGAALLMGGVVAANRSTDRRIEQAVSIQLLASQLALFDGPLGPTTPTSGTFASPEGFEWALAWTDAPLAPLAEATLTIKKGDHATHVVTYRPLVQP